MLIKVKAFPDSNREKIIRKSKDSFEIRIKEKPVRGLANKRITNILAVYFLVPESKVKLIKGFRVKNKTFEIK